MTGFFYSHQALFNLCLIAALLGISQYIVLRAGLFSLATAGLAAFGAYTSGILVLTYGVHPLIAILMGGVMGMIVALILAVPLVRLRGVFQAIATLAFVQIVKSFAFYLEGLTGGATGLNGIPKTVDTLGLLVALVLVLFFVSRLSVSPTGRAFDTIRQDETAAVAFGINVSRQHGIAFAVSGFVAGIAGALSASHNYSVVPEEFGFGMLIAALSFVVLGGRVSIWGPVVGAFVLTLLPEIARPLAENRMIVFGALLIAVIIYLPNGVVDTLVSKWKRRRHLASAAETAGRPVERASS